MDSTTEKDLKKFFVILHKTLQRSKRYKGKLQRKARRVQRRNKK